MSKKLLQGPDDFIKNKKQNNKKIYLAGDFMTAICGGHALIMADILRPLSQSNF